MHPWLDSNRDLVTVDKAGRQLMDFLSFIKPQMTSYGNFVNHKSAVACAFNRVFGFELGEHPYIKTWLKGWKIEKRPDLGMIRMNQGGTSV